MKKTILLVDTATEACSAAVFQLTMNEPESNDRLKPVSHVFEVAPRKQAELILTQVDTVLATAKLTLDAVDYLGFVRGPGAFTGVRVAASVIQGFAVAANKPVIGLSSLQIMAQMAYQQSGCKAVSAAIDARMDEVYWQNFRINKQGVMQPVDEASVLPPEQVQHTLREEAMVDVGTGWQRYETIFASHYAQRQRLESTIRYPDVGFAGELCVEAISAENFLKAEECTPFYLRDKVVKDPRSNVN